MCYVRGKRHYLLPASFLYVFSPVRAAVDQLGAPVLTAHYYTCRMLSTIKSVLYLNNFLQMNA